MLRVQTETLMNAAAQMNKQAMQLREQEARLRMIRDRLRWCGGNTFEKHNAAISRQCRYLEQEAEAARQMARVLQEAAERYLQTEKKAIVQGGSGSVRPIIRPRPIRPGWIPHWPIPWPIPRPMPWPRPPFGPFPFISLFHWWKWILPYPYRPRPPFHPWFSPWMRPHPRPIRYRVVHFVPAPSTPTITLVPQRILVARFQNLIAPMMKK